LDDALSAGAVVRPQVSVTGWAGPLTVETTSPWGLDRVEARAVLLATGARERPRSARLVPGDRPPGVLTTGQLQQLVFLHGQRLPGRAVVVGAEHVSFSAAVTLRHAGATVVAMVTELPRHQSFAAFRAAAAAAYRFPVLTGTRVTRVVGRGRLEAVELTRTGGSTDLLPCDTVVFTGDWIPDHELARRAGLDVDPASKGVVVDTLLRTSVPGVFAAGNLRHPVETADVVALDGRAAARSVTAFLSGTSAAPQPLAVLAEEPLRWVSPGRVGPGAPPPPSNRFTAWAQRFAAGSRLAVSQDGRVLWTGRRGTVVPNRALHLPADWLGAVDPRGGPVRLGVR
jgi:thioredoxin reductase